jgi:hypothetical protein
MTKHIKKKTAFRRFFQALEKFPMIGKTVWAFFQRLEKPAEKFPMVGKTGGKVSNDWKRSIGLPRRVLHGMLAGLLLGMIPGIAQAVDITWAGSEYTSLAVTSKVGDTVDF